MDVREKLVELQLKADIEDETSENTTKHREYIADLMIAYGVTFGKPLTEYLHPVDAYEGLKGKYLVFKADTGEQVVNCFVLRPDKDTAAVEALRAYALTTDNKTLANDIYNWVGKGVTVQEWIPVTERLPAMRGDGFADAFLVTDGYLGHIAYFVDGEWIFTENGEMKEPMFYDVTHWMPLPEPPKGE